MEHFPPYHKYYERNKSLKDGKIRVIEFRNITKLYWTTVKREFVLFVEVLNSPLKSAGICSIGVHAHLVKSKTLHERYSDLSQMYQLKVVAPLYSEMNTVAAKRCLWKNTTSPFVILDGACLYFIHNTKSTWNSADSNCKSMGGNLFSLDSFEQWHILMDNVRYLYPAIHQQFWMSPFIYLVKHTWVIICPFTNNREV